MPLHPVPMKVSESDESEFELDELGFEDDDDDDPNAFRVTGALSAPETRYYTTAELHEKIHNIEIDLSPPYQRDVVWGEVKQSSLIDSLWKNYHIPPIVFVSKREFDPDDREWYETLVCVDGKQRLTSIQRFLEGQIPHKINKTKWFFTCPDRAGANVKQIPQRWKDEFHSKKVNCVIYDGVNDDTEREMFRRVQHGMALTAAEKLLAVSSPMASYIGRLEKEHVLLEGGLGEILSWDVKRSKPFHNIMAVVYCCEGYPEERYSLTNISKWLETTREPSPSLDKAINKVFRELWEIAHYEHLNHPFRTIKAPVAPIEFIFIGVLLYIIRDRDLKTKAAAIKSLRTAVRATHTGNLRNNNVVAKVMWQYMRFFEKNPLGNPLETPSRSQAQSASRKSRPSKKRKADDDDSDYR
ncbi:hypothetical protein D9611_002730 [Ephemerocybe angulata]|uniref:GmrSD restriction endonucleases N-terminal domain-containing protein n=1 Tax=Ephemerocybe angulata TaxID=980116 RepID=A0A8H5FDJ5_9AGAR|nr:hypothetical protein D9611_002730 [Tulosesus angulatus]